MHLFQIHIRMPMVVIITMAVMVAAVIDFTIPYCSSLAGDNEESVKM